MFPFPSLLFVKEDGNLRCRSIGALGADSAFHLLHSVLPARQLPASDLITRTTPALPILRPTISFTSQDAGLTSCTLRKAKKGKEFPIARSAPACSMSAVSCGAGTGGDAAQPGPRRNGFSMAWRQSVVQLNGTGGGRLLQEPTCFFWCRCDLQVDLAALVPYDPAEWRRFG